MTIKTPEGEFLSAAEIATFSEGRKYFVTYHSPDGNYYCAYCGEITKMAPYTDTSTKSYWPSCCYREDCTDKWLPFENKQT